MRNLQKCTERRNFQINTFFLLHKIIFKPVFKHFLFAKYNINTKNLNHLDYSDIAIYIIEGEYNLEVFVMIIYGQQNTRYLTVMQVSFNILYVISNTHIRHYSSKS